MYMKCINLSVKSSIIEFSRLKADIIKVGIQKFHSVALYLKKISIFKVCLAHKWLTNWTL